MSAINFVSFAATFRRLHRAHVEQTYLVKQFDLLKQGVRDARIHDTSFNAWRELGYASGL